MRRFTHLLAWSCLVALPFLSAWTEDIRQDVAARLSRTDREALGRLAIMQPSALANLEALTRPERLLTKLEEMQSQQNWALSLREADSSGPMPWIQSALADVEGLQWSGSFQQQIPVPIDQGSRLEIKGSVIDLSPFWPNGMVPNATPAEGLHGQLVDVDDGAWEALNGKALKDSIVLMDFKGGRNWNRVFQLGAQAVIVVGDAYINRNNAERFFSNTPMPCPRYYVDAQTGARLREMLAVEATPQVSVYGGTLHEMRLAESRFVYLPAHAYSEITIRSADLLDRIAAEFDVSSNRLRELNELEGFELAVGQSLLLPGKDLPYAVQAEDLLKRLSREKAIELEAIKAANPGLDSALPAGTVLKIPALEKPVVVWVRVDAVSALPARLHGAHAMANTLAAVELIRHAAAMPEGSRRRGVIVGFLEGDTYGGQVSRGFLETYLDATGQLQGSLIASQSGGDDATLLARYRELGAGLTAETLGEVTEETAEWFLTEWFQNIFTQYRIQVAEARVASLLAAQEADDATLKVKYAEDVARMDTKIDEIIAFRKSTLENKELDPAQRLLAVMAGMGEVLEPMNGMVEGWTPARLRERLLRERDAEGLRQQIAAANQEVVKAVLSWMHPDGEPNTKQPIKGYWLDLSTGSHTLEMVPLNKDYRQVFPFKDKVLNAVIEQFDRAQVLAALQAGWQNPWSFVGNNVEAVFPKQDVMSAPSYLDFWAHLGVGLITLRAANDTRPLADTPLDTVGNLDPEAYADLLRTVLLLNSIDLQDSRGGEFPSALNVGLFSRLIGTTTKFNIRSGIDAKDPVGFTLVSYPSILKKAAGSQSKEWGGHNTATFMGNRIGVQVFSLVNGRFSLPLELLSFVGLTDVYAYKQDPETGLFAYVFDGGRIGTQIQSQNFNFLPGQDTFKNLILYPLAPYVVSMGVEPLQYSMPSAGQLPLIQDAVMKGRPRHVNLEHPRIHFGESELSGMIVYMEPGRRMTLIDKRAGAIRGLLLGDLPEDDLTDLTGKGLLIGPTEGDRNLVLPLGAYHVAKSMYGISARRVAIYENFGIRDQALSQTIVISGRKIAEAEAYIEARNWKAAIGRSREAWGMLVKSYPTMLKLGREAVLSVVILMALLVPTSVFIERLLIGSKTMIARLGGAVILFSLGTLFLNFFHPAFQIATSPFIVVIAFAMIFMASTVLGICYQRFEILVRRARIAGGEAESEEISFASTLTTAFSLGVSNLKKRPTRTLLTAFTVTVLTFSIVSFVSIKGQDQLYMRPIVVDTTVGGKPMPIETIEPVAYNGALFRKFSWAPLSIDFIEAVETEFGSQFPVARRMSFIEVAGGNNANREGVNQIEITYQGQKAITTALMGFEPQEKSFSGLNRAVSGGQWFRRQAEAAPFGENEDRFHIILPRRIAEELAIKTSDILTEAGQRLPEVDLPTVEMMGNAWKVIGILNTDEADRIRDINGKSLALVDYVQSAITPNMGRGSIETEDEHSHMNWTNLVLLPVSARHDVGADWLSLAVKFPADFDFATFRDEMARRMDSAIYANIDGELSMLSARKQRSVGGLAKIIVPVLLCILIVSNTMMGTIEERVGEVKMLGAIGLSPSQISFLLLSESTVFSCIGIVFGTFAGLIFSKVVGLYGGAMGQLSFNFTSLSSTALAMGTGGIVLLATLIPAKKAAAMAAPSGMEKWELPERDAEGAIDFTLPFTLTAGNAVGMVAFFRRFLLNHIDSSSKDFICKNPEVSVGADGSRLIRARLWLAPYDLDVSQNLALYIQPANTEGVYTVRIHLLRQSGTEDAWVRTNYQFLNLVRKQFLLWRNLQSALRLRYIEEGQGLLAKGDAV